MINFCLITFSLIRMLYGTKQIQTFLVNSYYEMTTFIILSQTTKQWIRKILIMTMMECIKLLFSKMITFSENQFTQVVIASKTYADKTIPPIVNQSNSLAVRFTLLQMHLSPSLCPQRRKEDSPYLKVPFAIDVHLDILIPIEAIIFGLYSHGFPKKYCFCLLKQVEVESQTQPIQLLLFPNIYIEDKTSSYFCGLNLIQLGKRSAQYFSVHHIVVKGLVGKYFKKKKPASQKLFKYLSQSIIQASTEIDIVIIATIKITVIILSLSQKPFLCRSYCRCLDFLFIDILS